MGYDLRGRTVVLGVAGGIAAYKSAELVRLMVKAGARVRVMATRNATAFVGPMTFAALSGEPVCTDLFAEGGDEGAMRHIDWAQGADAAVVAPATANLVGKLANGIADDALTTFLLAVTAPVLICPAMNTHMYESRPVGRNLERLRRDGRMIVAPGAGELACGTSGPGRMAEPVEILDRLAAALTPKDLGGRKVLVTAGPTREHLDPVRFISNPSSGKMGYAVARAAEARGAEVTLVSGPVSLPPPINVSLVRVVSAYEMADAVLARLDDAEVVIKTAAVGDYGPKEFSARKIKKAESGDAPVLALKRTPDILHALGLRKGHRFLVGFAAETEALEQNAVDKLTRKNLDMIVGNRVDQPGSGFGTDTNLVTFFHSDGTVEALDEMDKDAVAHCLLDRIRDRMDGGDNG